MKKRFLRGVYITKYHALGFHTFMTKEFENLDQKFFFFFCALYEWLPFITPPKCLFRWRIDVYLDVQ